MAAKSMGVAVLILTLAVTGAANWPQFRGPDATGVVSQGALPDRWSETENVRWKTAIPGHGWSSPIVWGDRIFVTSAVSSEPIEPPKPGLYLGGNREEIPTAEQRFVVYAIDLASGRVIWQTEVRRSKPVASRHLKNTFASETPVTDGERVYAHFGNHGLYALDWNGKVLWERHWGPFPTRYGWGTAASPVLHEGRLYIVSDTGGQSFLEAIDKRTGKTIWRVDRDEESNWATPFVWRYQVRTEIVTAGRGKVRSYDLDGKPLWELAPMSSIVAPTPFAHDGLLYVASGYVGDEVRPVFAVRPGAKGDISPKSGAAHPYIAWTLPQAGPYIPSPLVYEGHYYTLFDRGFLTCHEAATGKEIYGKVRIDPAAGAFTASPWAAGGKLYLLSEDGDTFVVRAGPKYELLGKNSLGEMTMATPAIANGSLIIRTASHLYRIGPPR